MALPAGPEAAVVEGMKIGFMGGSFDPVHIGHLIAAQDALEGLQLDKVVLVPAAQAPLKPDVVQSTAEDRLAMLRLAIEPGGPLEVSDYEVTKGGISYTIETVRHFRQRHPHDDFYWLIGADQVLQLAKWKEISELVKLTEFVYFARPGYPENVPLEIPGLRLRRCQGHLIEISSSELRERVRRSRKLNRFCPQKVIAYIEEKRLYR